MLTVFVYGQQVFARVNQLKAFFCVLDSESTAPDRFLLCAYLIVRNEQLQFTFLQRHIDFNMTLLLGVDAMLKGVFNKWS